MSSQTSSSCSQPSLNASDRKSTRLNSSHGYISYAVFCLKKKKILADHSDLTSCLLHVLEVFVVVAGGYSDRAGTAAGVHVSGGVCQPRLDSESVRCRAPA